MLNIDSLLSSQKPIADQDISVQWGQAVEADIRQLDSRTTGVSGVSGGFGGAVPYGSTSGNDSGWSGTKVNCSVYAYDGKLYPNSTTFHDGALTYDTGSTYDNWVTSFSYTSQSCSFPTTLLVGGTINVVGTFPYGTPLITAEYSANGGATWAPLTGSQSGATFTIAPVQMNRIRFTATVPQASTGAPASLTSYSMSFNGKSYGETLVIDVPLAGTDITYSLPYPVVPGAAFFPFFQAGQRLRADVSNLTTTGCRLQLVTDDGVYSPMNGRGLLIVALG
jgi:hypothetical protein